MKIFANKVNGSYLRDVLPPSDTEVDGVKAAIAYGSDASSLVHDCLENGYRLDIWMRYDHTVPVSPELLEHLLKNIGNNVFCRLVPDVLHSKVIWWKNYGVYIGSANLTERAWVSNIEVGVFLSEGELENSGCLKEIESFFEQIASYQEVFPLSSEIIEEQKRRRAERTAIQAIERQGRAARSVPEWGGPVSIADRKTMYSRSRDLVPRHACGVLRLELPADVLGLLPHRGELGEARPVADAITGFGEEQRPRPKAGSKQTCARR